MMRLLQKMRDALWRALELAPPHGDGTCTCDRCKELLQVSAIADEDLPPHYSFEEAVEILRDLQQRFPRGVVLFAKPFDGLHLVNRVDGKVPLKWEPYGQGGAYVSYPDPEYGVLVLDARVLPVWCQREPASS